MALHSYPYPSYGWQYQGFDFYGMPNIDQSLADLMYADGVRFVGRYLYADQYPNGKGISAAEAQYYLNAGIRIFLYYEVNTTDALGGYDRGQLNGLNCLAQAQQLSVPAGTQIYCACDTGVTDAQAAGVVMDYLHGFADALPDYNTGIYGGSNVMSACYNAYPNNYRCQAGAWGSQEFDPINVRQWYLNTNNRAYNDGYINIANITIDSNGYAYWRGVNVDLCSAENINNMWGDGSPTPPTPPGPAPERSSMPLWFYLRPI